MADDPEPDRYLRWITGRHPWTHRGIDQLLIDYKPDGWATRELGLDAAGVVVHRYPSELHRWGDYGFFADGYPEIVEQPVAAGDAIEITAAEFASVWDRPAVEPPIQHQSHPGWRERLRRIRHPRSI